MSHARAHHGLLLAAASGAGPTTWNDEIAFDSPSLWWKLDETSGSTYADASGNGRDGTGSGTIVQNQAGLFSGSSKSIDVSGTGVVSVASQSALFAAPSFTVMGVGKLANLSVDNYLLGYGIGSGGNDWGMALRVQSDGTVGFLIVTTSAGDSLVLCQTTTGYITNDGLPHMFHGKWEVGVGAKLYVDGALAATANSALTGVRSNTTPFVAGQAINGTTKWNGLIDEIARFPGALSGTRIAAHYAARNV